MQLIGSIENKVNLPVCKMFLSTAPRRKGVYRNHKHAEFELSVILKGTGNYRTTTGDLDIRAGDIFLFSTNEAHCITDIDCDEIEILNLHVQPSFVWSLGEDFLGKNYLNIFFQRNDSFRNRLDRENPATEDVTRFLFSIREEFETQRDDFNSAIKLKILQALITVQREFPIAKKQTDMSISTQHIAAIAKAVNYIDKNFTSNISLDALAKIALISKSYFCTIFKKLNGLSPWEYINIKRINMAVDLLRSTQLSVLNIATQCGYNNTSNFNKIFKSVTGQTPKVYRILPPPRR